MEIIRARTHHAPTMVDLYPQVLPHAMGSLPPPDVATLQALLSSEQPMFVALEGDQAVGMILAYDMVIWTYIDTLVVHKDHRGKGIAGQLVAAVQNYKPWTYMQLCHDSELPELGEFAKKSGFIPETGLWKIWYK